MSQRQLGGDVSKVFILTVLLIYPLPQLAIDIYLPSWPKMSIELHTPPHLLQVSLTIYILVLGLMQLVYGFCSDYYGRKPVLLLGCFIFAIGSLACLFVQSVEQLLWCRVVQGVGMGCGFTVASAILADVFTDRKLAKMTSYSSMIYSLAIILAPVAGGYLQHYSGWRASFAVMLLYAVILSVMIYSFVFETNKPNKRRVNNVKCLLYDYLACLSNVRFMANVLCLSIAYGLMIAFNVVAPFLLQNVLHVTVIAYGQLVLIVGLAYFVGVTCNSRLVGWWSLESIILFGLIIMFISSFSLFVVSEFNWQSATSVILFTSLAMIGIGFIFPNCYANALAAVPEKGASSAFIGSLGLIGASIVSYLVSHLCFSQQLHLAQVYVVLAGLSILSYLVTKMSKGDPVTAFDN